MRVSLDRLLAVIGLSLAASGCLPITSKTPREFEGVFFSAPRPEAVVNIAYTRTDGWHRYRDPDETPFGPIQVRHIQVISSADDKMVLAAETNSAFFPFLVRHEYRGNILLAAGYNPVVLGDWLGSIWDAIKEADKQFASKYRYDERLQKKQRVDDVRYVSSEAAYHVNLRKLPENPKDVEAGAQVDHGFLLYLLNESQLWAQLKARRKSSDDSRAAVREFCRAILRMIDAHDLQWPDYQWAPEHRKLRAWCEEVAGAELRQQP
jgi:hypothetical protein